jgi:hypothetical protein
MSESSQATGTGDRPGTGSTSTHGATSVETGAAGFPLQRGGAPDARRRPGGRWASTRPAYRYLHVTAAAVGAAVVSFALANTLGGGADTHTVTGTLAVWHDGSAITAGTACDGTGAFSDIRAGTQLRIVGDGVELGAGVLQPGRSNGSACAFGFLVPGVAKAGAYQLVVGDDRVAAELSYADMRERSWNARVSLGA